VGGQIVRAEDRDGQSWQIECLGEPLEIGARIAFSPLGAEADRRGEMVRLLDAERTSWICTLRRGPGGIQLTPFGGVRTPELKLSEADSKGAPDGARVLVVPVESGGASRSRGKTKRAGRGRSKFLRVRVARVLGMPFEPDSDHRAVIWKHRLATDFSRRARLEVEEIEERLSAHELGRRLDLRHLPFITIDPASARDHDDAVFAEQRPKQPVAIVPDPTVDRDRPGTSRKIEMTWRRRLWVAIADVSHFVAQGGWVDAEARRRGNSFYFPDRSIPMLPERLSSDLCSLRVGVDRLALVVELRIDASGAVADALFHEAVIRSQAGLSYEEAAKWLAEADQDSGSAVAGAGLNAEWGDSLRCLREIAESLSRARRAAGSLFLDLPEVEVEVDDEGRPKDARLRERNPAHELIEEAMLAANRAVARKLDGAERDAVHRSHPPPSPQKLAALSALLERLGTEVAEDLDAPGVLANLLEQVEGTPSEERIHVAVLRSMSQARYEPKSLGHYALRFEHYVHFTSPIRRYADLEIHRVLKSVIRGERIAKSPAPEAERLAARLAIWLSGRERLATEVEREADSLACCSLMSGREGESFDASVTGATEFGLFVRLDSPAVSGLVPMRSLEGYWIFDAEDEALIGERSGRRIALGDRIFVELIEVDPDRARLSFRMAPKRKRTRPGK
jgi:ribonuclease R